MCFSQDASFVAAGALSIAGIVLICRLYKSRKILLALIPLFFGIQQCAEGVVWVDLNNNSYLMGYGVAAQYLFMFFAKMFWPVWIPLAFAAAEKIQVRQVVMWFLMVLGFGFFFTSGYEFIMYRDVNAKIVNHSISYGGVPLLYQMLYAVITMAPLFLSSISKMWMLGIANVTAFVIATVFYEYAFVSVWCAVAAILAIGLLFLLKKDRI